MATDIGWLVTNESLNFAHYFDGREFEERVEHTDARLRATRCGLWLNEKPWRRAAWIGDETREPSRPCGSCLRSVLALLPKVMRDAIKPQRPNFAAESAERYLVADEETRADILAFFESDGPRKVHESKLKINEGIPTSAELEEELRG